MKFKFNPTEKFILREALKAVVDGIKQTEVDQEKAALIVRVKRTINQLDYNSYVTEIHRHVGAQIYELMQGVHSYLEQSELRHENPEIFQERLDGVKKLLEIFEEYNKYIKELPNRIGEMLKELEETNWVAINPSKQCNYCENDWTRKYKGACLCMDCYRKLMVYRQKSKQLQKMSPSELLNTTEIDNASEV